MGHPAYIFRIDDQEKFISKHFVMFIRSHMWYDTMMREIGQGKKEGNRAGTREEIGQGQGGK